VAHQGRSPADESLALHLASGMTVEAAAQAAGVSRRTATRRLTEEGFRKRVDELRGELLDRSLRIVVGGMANAGEVLRSLLASESEAIKLRAAKELIDAGVKLRAAVEQQRQIEELVADMKKLKGQDVSPTPPTPA
jgi:hypothetical protein